MTAHAEQAASPATRRAGSHTGTRARRAVSWTLLLAVMPFGPRLRASAVAEAIAAGLTEAGLGEPEVVAFEAQAGPIGEPGEVTASAAAAGAEANGIAPVADVDAALQRVDFDSRMRAARAVVIIAARLDERTLLGSLPFEIATRARQAGVPAYAIVRENALVAFDARILDLQMVIEARSRQALRRAGGTLAEIV